MTNYRTFNARVFTAGETGSLERAWGILRDSTGAGVVYLEGQVSGYGTPTPSYATMSLADINSGVPFPCYVRKVEVSAGRVYILA